MVKIVSINSDSMQQPNEDNVQFGMAVPRRPLINRQTPYKIE